MTTITRTVKLACDADAVWSLVGDFASIDRWHPDVQAPELRGPDGPGRERVFAAGTPEELVERLTERDDRQRRLVYSMPQPPFAITDHEARLTVAPVDGQTSEVAWSASFQAAPDVADGLEAALGDGVFDVGLTALAERFGRA